MKLENFNNKFVKITDIDDQTFVGICLFEDKEVYDEEYDGLSIQTGNRWIKLFENEIVQLKLSIKIKWSKNSF